MKNYKTNGEQLMRLNKPVVMAWRNTEKDRGHCGREEWITEENKVRECEIDRGEVY